MKVLRIIIAAVVTVTAIGSSVWLWGVNPTPTQTVNPPAPSHHRDRPAYEGRLNLTSMEGRSNPALVFYRRPIAADITQIEKDVCNGRGMKEDHYFRQVRAALIVNNTSFCPGPFRRLRFVAPASVWIGKWPGVVLTLVLTALLAVIVGLRWYAVWRDWRAWSQKVLAV